MNDSRLLLVGCGILDKEVRWLIEKNRWPVDVHFLESSLHVNFGKLAYCLTCALDEHRGRELFVFYGCCHPLMDNMLAEANTFRTEGQNCIDMLLGHELFFRELENGAFFLLEDWARSWDTIITKTFGTNEALVKEIFQGDRKYLLCLRTPCSGDFSQEAEKAGQKVGLPLRWMDVTLNHLESVLQDAITRKREEMACQSKCPT